MALLSSSNTSPATPVSPCSSQTGLQAASETYQPQGLCTDHFLCPERSLPREPMAPTVHSCHSSEPTLKTAYPPPRLFYLFTLLHLSPCVLLSPFIILTCLFIVCLPLESKPRKGRALVCLVHHHIPRSKSVPQGSAGIRNVNENCQVGQVPLSALLHAPFPYSGGVTRDPLGREASQDCAREMGSPAS